MCAKLAKEKKCDAVIGLGGGSSLDAAKMVAALVNNKGSCGEYLFDKTTSRAIGLIFENLRTACDKPKDDDARRNMALASLTAGLAFSNTGTAAVHSISYAFTVLFGVSHGEACGLTLPSFIGFNCEEDRKMLDEFAGAMNTDNPVNATKKLLKDISLATSLEEIGATEEDIPEIVDYAFLGSHGNNPREVTREDLERILREEVL